jgi:zinc D-Ala-D-Ala dipeptidase
MSATLTRSMCFEDVLSSADFVSLRDVKGIAIDLRYAGTNNFVGRSLYSDYDYAWLHREAAEGLRKAVAYLRIHHPAYRFLVLDALRPHEMQKLMWESLSGSPFQRYFADPAKGSIHSFGMALDLTLIDHAGQEVDMGSGFDSFAAESHPEYEIELLHLGKLTAEHISHRSILRDALFHAGFQGIQSEWWHFNFGDPEVIRRTLTRID